MVPRVRRDIAVSVWQGIRALAFLIAGCANPLPPVEEVRFDCPYTIMARSDDGEILALGTGLEARYHHEASKSQLVLLNSNDLKPLIEPIPFDNRVSQIAFVSAEFGFVVAVSDDLRVALTDKSSENLGSLHRVMLDGTTQLIKDGLPMPIVSVAVSPDHKIAALCIAGDAFRDATCRFMRLDDGTTVSTFAPKFCLHLTASFGSDSNHCLLATDGRRNPVIGYPDSEPFENSKRLFLVKSEDGSLFDEMKDELHSSGTGIGMTIFGNQTDKKMILGPAFLHGVELDDHKIIDGKAPDLSMVSEHGQRGVIDFDIDADEHWIAAADTYDGSPRGCKVSFVDFKSGDVATRAIARPDHLYQVLFSKDGTSLDVLVMTKPHFNSVLARYDLRELTTNARSK